MALTDNNDLSTTAALDTAAPAAKLEESDRIISPHELAVDLARGAEEAITASSLDGVSAEAGSAQASAGTYELHLTNGRFLRLGADYRIDSVRELLQLLESDLSDSAEVEASPEVEAGDGLGASPEVEASDELMASAEVLASGELGASPEVEAVAGVDESPEVEATDVIGGSPEVEAVSDVEASAEAAPV